MQPSDAACLECWLREQGGGVVVEQPFNYQHCTIWLQSTKNSLRHDREVHFLGAGHLSDSPVM